MIALDAEWRRVESMCVNSNGRSFGPVRRELAKIRAAVSAMRPRPIVEERAYGRWRPLTESMLACLEGRNVSGDRLRTVSLVTDG